MKILNNVETQNYDLDHWKISTDHKKTSIRKCQQNFNGSQWLMLCWYKNLEILHYVDIILKLCWSFIEEFWVYTIYKFEFITNNYKDMYKIFSKNLIREL